MSNRRDFLRRLGVGSGAMIAAPTVLGSQLSAEIPPRPVDPNDIFYTPSELPQSEYDFVVISYQFESTDNEYMAPLNIRGDHYLRRGRHQESGSLEMYCYGEFLQKFMDGTIGNEAVELVLPIPNMDAAYIGKVKFASMSIHAPSMAEDMIINADFIVLGSMQVVTGIERAQLGTARGKHGNKGEHRS